MLTKNIVFTGPNIDEIKEYVDVFHKIFICNNYEELIKNINYILLNKNNICDKNLEKLKNFQNEIRDQIKIICDI